MNRHPFMEELSCMAANNEINENAYNKLSKKLKEVQESTFHSHTHAVIKYEKIKIHLNYQAEGDIDNCTLDETTKIKKVFITYRLLNAIDAFCKSDHPDDEIKRISSLRYHCMSKHYQSERDQFMADWEDAFKYIPCLYRPEIYDMQTTRFISINKETNTEVND